MRSRLFFGGMAVGLVVFVACVSDEPAGPGGGTGDGGEVSDSGSSGDGSTGDACATTCGSSCVSLDTDKTNCGACGHDCLGGDCNGGKCAASALFSGGGTNPTTSGVIGIAVDGANIFWTTPHPQHPGAPPGVPSNMYDCPKAGPCATPTTYLTQTDEIDSMMAFAPGVLLQADQSMGAIQRVRTDGLDAGGSASCPTGNPCFYSLSTVGAATFAFDPAAIFIGSNGDGTHGSGLFLLPLDGGAPYLLNSAFTAGSAVTSVAVDPVNGYVYASVYANADVEAFRVDLKSSAPTAKASTQPNVGHILVAGGQVFWTRPDTGDVLKAPACIGPNCGTGTLTPSTFASTLGSDSIMSDTTNVYWSAGSDIYMCPITGCGGAPKKMGSGGAHITAITNDDQAVYWGDDTGSIWKLAK